MLPFRKMQTVVDEVTKCASQPSETMFDHATQKQEQDTVEWFGMNNGLSMKTGGRRVYWRLPYTYKHNTRKHIHRHTHTTCTQTLTCIWVYLIESVVGHIANDSVDECMKISVIGKRFSVKLLLRNGRDASSLRCVKSPSLLMQLME